MKELALTKIKVGGDLTKLTEDVDAIVAELAGWVVTSDNLKETKEEMALINKIDTAMHQKRKDLAKEYKKDLVVFENAIKVESEKLQGAREKLKVQADDFEIKRIQAKSEECNALLESMLEESDLEEEFKDLVCLPNGFTNASMTMGSIRKAIETSIINAKADQETFKRNCVTLQNHIEVLNLDNNLANTVKYVTPSIGSDFMQLMADATEKAGDRAISERLAEDALLKKQEEKKVDVKITGFGREEEATEVVFPNAVMQKDEVIVKFLAEDWEQLKELADFNEFTYEVM